MISKMLKLDCTDFLLTIKDKSIVVHEFEGMTALVWHVKEVNGNKNIIDIADFLL